MANKLQSGKPLHLWCALTSVTPDLMLHTSTSVYCLVQSVTAVYNHSIPTFVNLTVCHRGRLQLIQTGRHSDSALIPITYKISSNGYAVLWLLMGQVLTSHTRFPVNSKMIPIFPLLHLCAFTSIHCHLHSPGALLLCLMRLTLPGAHQPLLDFL